MEGSAESTNARDELFGRARQLETDASEVGEDGSRGRALRAEAAELRRQALGERVYPVLVCSSCFRLTGWVAADGSCDACLRRAQIEAAYEDPHGGWVSLVDTRVWEAPPPPLPLGARLAAMLGMRAALRREIARAWLSRVEPGDTGPVDPETGYELEGAERDDVDAAEGTGLVIRFTTATHRFDGSAWIELPSTRISDWDTLTPSEFSAGLPIEQLAEAWGDYGAEVVAFNRAAWSRKSEEREAARQAQRAREDTLRDQRGVADLLAEDGERER